MFTILNATTDLTHDPRKLNLNGTPSNLQLKPQAEITWITAKAQRYSPSYKIADCELSNSYLLTHKIFSSNRFFITW